MSKTTEKCQNFYVITSGLKWIQYNQLGLTDAGTGKDKAVASSDSECETAREGEKEEQYTSIPPAVLTLMLTLHLGGPSPVQSGLCSWSLPD